MKNLLLDVTGVVVGFLALWTTLRRNAAERTKAIQAAAICLVTAVVVFWTSLPPDPFEDFRDHYYLAGNAVLDSRAALTPLLNGEVHVNGFVNLPIVAYLWAPFALLPVSIAEGILTAVGVLSIVSAWALIVRLAGLEGNSRWLLLFLFAASGPLHNSLREGNTTHMMLLVLALGLHFLRSGRALSAGLLLGAGAIIKLPLLLLGAWFLVRRDWRAAAGFGAACGTAGLLSIAVFGWSANEQWFENSVWQYSTQPIGAWNVQSIPAFLVRLVNEPQVLLEFEATRSPGAAQRLASIVLVGLLYVIALVVSRVGRRRLLAQPRASAEERRELEYLLVVTLAVVTSPLSWSHYYTLLLLPIAFLLGSRLRSVRKSRLRWLTWIGIVLTTPAVLIVGTDRLAGDGPVNAPEKALLELYAKVAISHLLYGGLILFAALAWARARAETEAGATDRTQAVAPVVVEQ